MDDLQFPIYVIGYPKSGTSFTSRLLGDVLNSPVKAPFPRVALAEEGLERDGEFVVYQSHLTTLPQDKEYAIIHILRDPRDIAISAQHYWQISRLHKTLLCMGTGKWPIPHGGGWDNFVRLWVNKHKSSVTYTTHYEQISTNSSHELADILKALGTDPVNPIEQVTKRQSFDARVKHVDKHGDTLPYGKVIQRRLLRKGMVGDWNNHFTRSLGRTAQKQFGEMMLELGYVTHEDWWKDLPETL